MHMTSLNGQDSQIPDNEPTLNGVDHTLHKAEGAFCVSVSACCGVCLIVCQMIGVLRMRSHLAVPTALLHGQKPG